MDGDRWIGWGEGWLGGNGWEAILTREGNFLMFLSDCAVYLAGERIEFADELGTVNDSDIGLI